MKEASGELNLTLITVVAIGLIAALFAFVWDDIEQAIRTKFKDTSDNMNGLNVGMSLDEYEFTDYVETELF